MNGNADLVRRVVAALTGDVEQIGGIGGAFAPGYELRKPGFSAPLGPAAFTMYAREWRRAFPDYRLDLHAVLSDGEYVTCLVTASGTHTGTWLGTPPSGRAFSVTGAEVHRVVDGLLVTSWLLDDVPRVLMDSGVLAATGASANRWT